MKHYDPDGNPLPKGMFFDPERERYRVRVYRHSKPVWCSYHHDYVSARRAYALARQAREDYIATEHLIITPDCYASVLRQA